MSEETDGNSTIRSYLLGNLPESEAERIERWYFADGQAVDEVWAVFGELAEERLSGALSESEARRFEQRLQSSPALRKMFENEQALRDHAALIATSAPQQAKIADSVSGGRRQWRLSSVFFKPPRLVVAGAIMMIALGALSAWFALRAPESRTHKGQQQTKAQDQSIPESVGQASGASQPPPQSGRGADDRLVAEKKLPEAPPDQRKSASEIAPEITPTFLLLVASSRGGESYPILEIPARTETVQLELELTTDDCAAFSAVLQTESGEELQRWERLQARPAHSTLKVATLRVAADSLKNASYVVMIECVSRTNDPASAARYRFRAERK